MHSCTLRAVIRGDNCELFFKLTDCNIFFAVLQ